MKRALTLVIVLLMLSCSAALGWMYMKSHETKQAEELRVEELSSILTPLEEQKQLLEKEYSAVRAEAKMASIGNGTVEFFVRTSSSAVYTDFYPLLKKNSLTAVLGLNINSLPGDDGNITLEQYQKLLNEGWETCLIYDGSDEIKSWEKTATKRLSEKGLNKPSMLYYSKASGDEKEAELFSSLGYSTIIHITSKDKIVTTEFDNPWYLSLTPWYFIQDTDIVSNIIKKGGNVVYSISPSESENDYAPSEALQETLDYYMNNTNTSNLLFTSIKKARKTREEAIKNADSISQSYQNKLDEIQSQIDDLNKQIKEVYIDWNDQE